MESGKKWNVLEGIEMEILDRVRVKKNFHSPSFSFLFLPLFVSLTRWTVGRHQFQLSSAYIKKEGFF